MTRPDAHYSRVPVVLCGTVFVMDFLITSALAFACFCLANMMFMMLALEGHK
jgi:hypothetical protein